jgi:hypothetical protein
MAVTGSGSAEPGSCWWQLWPLEWRLQMFNVARRPVLARNLLFLGGIVAVVSQVIAGHYYSAGVSCACGAV